METPTAGGWEHGVSTMTDADAREFMLVLRRAMLMVVRWIERRYGVGGKHD